MATLSPGNFTYAEHALRMDPTGKIATLVNLMSQQNDIMMDMMGVECQSGNAFEYTQVVRLPAPTKRLYNAGVPATMAGVAKQVTVAVEYADWSKIDASLARLGGNLTELRAQELGLHMQGMGQTVSTDLFYANRATDPTAFTGLSNIYNTVSTATSQIANNVIDAGGSGSDNASIWLIGWGPKQIHTIFPKGLPAGLEHIDYGDRVPAVDSNGNEFPVYRDWLAWRIGLAIHDWRYAVRICNIDVSDLSGGSAANLINLLSQAFLKPPTVPTTVGPVQSSDAVVGQLMMPRFAIYMNRTLWGALDRQAQNKTNVLLQMTQWDGHPVLTYRGIPLRICDSLLNTESRVV